jgi:hypothetical protein
VILGWALCCRGKNAMKDINEIVEKIRIWPIDKIYQY